MHELMEQRPAPAVPPFVPIVAKVRRPTLRGDLVPRKLIVDGLIDSADVPMVLITAPPGFGKTVAVAQWDTADPRPFAWVSLDEADDDPRAFLSYVSLALQQIRVFGDRLMSLAVDNPVSLAADRLDWVADTKDPSFVLVLDGTDAVKSNAVYETVMRIANYLPPGSQVALVGRAAPPFDYETLRAENRLVEVGTEDLRLNRDEGMLLVDLAGVHLSSDTVDVLLEETEGWAAGMYLTVVRADRQDTEVDVADIGTDHAVADYLRDEVLDPLPPADQVFLRRCSILKTLSAPLCDAVVETRDSTDTLRRLAQENIVILQDERSASYRIPHLFAQAMEAELARQEPRLVKSLHGRASNWLEQAGDLDEAIRHAIAEGNVARSAELIWKRAPTCIATGRIVTVEQWLDAFTRQQVVSEAKLALTAALCALARGLPVDHWLAAAERGHYDAARPGEPRSIAAAVALLHAMVARNGVVQMGADARLSISLRGDDDESTCIAEFLDAMSAYLAHGADRARSQLESVERRAAGAGDHAVRAAAQTELAMMSLAEADWTTAANRAGRAIRLARGFNIEDLALLMLLPCIQALLAIHAGRRHNAETRVRSCSRALARQIQLAPWLGVQCRLVLAKTHLMLGDAAATRAMLSEAQTLLRRIPDAPVLHDDVHELWRQVEQLPIDIAAGASTLSTAELRVLQLLPTYLSFEEIGRQLFVSRNTVKTQAIAAYRKLGVTSRAEAVERANSLGLISS